MKPRVNRSEIKIEMRLQQGVGRFANRERISVLYMAHTRRFKVAPVDDEGRAVASPSQISG
jgi:hypothetical protein